MTLARMKRLGVCLITSLLFTSSAFAATEFVTVIKILDNDDQAIIERRNGERWLIEKGAGATSFGRFEGKKVLVQSPGTFGGAGSTIVLPEMDQEARIWSAELIDAGRTPTAGNDERSVHTQQITRSALSHLGYYAPQSRDRRKKDPTLALRAFQKRSKLESTGNIDSATLDALSKAVSTRKPITDQSRQLAAALVAAARSLESIAGSPPGSPKPSGINNANDSMIESRIDGDFEGWEGETVVKLMNGQVWQQTEFYYHYYYAYMPKALIVKSGSGYRMTVDGVPKAVGVARLK